MKPKERHPGNKTGGFSAGSTQAIVTEDGWCCTGMQPESLVCLKDGCSFITVTLGLNGEGIAPTHVCRTILNQRQPSSTGPWFTTDTEDSTQRMRLC